MSINTTRVIGMEELRNILRDVAPNEARNLSRSTTQAFAQEVRAALKAEVKKDTGETAKSIVAKRRRPRGDEVSSVVRVGKKEAFHLEYGTHDTTAQPFFRPVVHRFRGLLEDRYRELFGKKYEELLKRKAKG